MATEKQTKKRPILSHEADVTTYVYNKNRRFPVEAGTRASNVLIGFGGGRGFRAGIQNKAIALAIEEWELRWGEFPWDLSQIMVTHLTCQVLVEVRVEPL